MAKRYPVTRGVRVANWFVRMLNRVGLGGSRTFTLTTLGRRTGKARSTPVTLVELAGLRYLVAPYGSVGWVQNLRAGGIATISRAGKDESVRARSLSATEAGPVLAHYYATVKITRPYFDVPAQPSTDDFIAIARNHPVFEVSAT